MSTHTPGPWAVDATGFNVIRTTDDGTHTIAITQPNAWMRSNARLIAAAPELLRSVGNLINLCEALARQDTIPEELKQALADNAVLAEARDAFAKATEG